MALGRGFGRLFNRFLFEKTGCAGKKERHEGNGPGGGWIEGCCPSEWGFLLLLKRGWREEVGGVDGVGLGGGVGMEVRACV